jgi:hypothetical protein
MNFQIVKGAIISLLTASASAGRFSVMAYQQVKHDADDIAEYNRHVSVFYKSGSFASSSRPNSGILQHDMTFQVDMLVSANALVDLQTLDDPQSTPLQRASALGAYYDAGAHADDLMDDLWAQIFAIIVNPVNHDLGLAVGTIADIPGTIRLGDYQKADVARQGQTVLLGASCTLRLRCAEKTVGDTSNQPLVGIDSKVNITADIATSVPDPNAAPAEFDIEALSP